ncbi:MAG TPA: MFS transporter, partial [Acidimicrobiales bacterium]|nr:MFS transporter [Acidimicrobiales bacterium]
AAVRRLLLDVTPLRESRDYRFLFCGQAVGHLGGQLSVVAVPFQVYLLTGSSLAVGMVGLASLVPLAVLSLVGGSVADAVDRRKLLVVTQSALTVISAALALNATAGDDASLAAIYVLAALNAGFNGIDLPTRNAILPNLVRREKFTAAASLGQALIQVGQVLGPALAGLVLSRWGLAVAYWLDAATSVVAIALTLAIRPQPPQGGGTRAGLSSIREGLAYLKGRRLILSTFVIDINAMVFGMPRALFPALATGLYGGGAATLGLLHAAPGAGALVGALFTGWVGAVRRQGWAVILAVIAWGAAIAAFGLVSWLPLGLLLLALAGAADVISAVFRSTILQLSVPDALRGRLNSVHIAVVTGGPRLGDAEAGVVAALTTPRFSVVSGGLACVVGALVVAKALPQLARYDALAERAGGLPGYDRGREPDHGNGARRGSEP